MSDREEYHNSHVGDADSESEEVVFKTTTATSPTAPSVPITRSDLEEIIEGWKEKFRKITEGMRAIEQATEEVHAHMNIVTRDNRTRDNEQVTANNRIKQIQEGLARFIERCDPAHPTLVRPFESLQGTDRISPLRPLLTRQRQQSPRAAAEVMTSANDLRTRMNMEQRRHPAPTD